MATYTTIIVHGLWDIRDDTSAGERDNVTIGNQSLHSLSAKLEISADNDGFTLVELLIVIGIIALLIAILLPVFAKVRRQAQDLTCVCNLRQIGAALVSYSVDNHGYLPAAKAMLPNNLLLPWQVALFNYLSKPLVPETQLTLTNNHSYLLGTIFICPKAVLNDLSAFSQTIDYLAQGYDINIDLPGVDYTVKGASSSDLLHMQSLRQYNRVCYGSDTLLAADGVSGWVSYDSTGDGSVIVAPTNSEFNSVAGVQQNRHPVGFVNCLMCDGSVTPRHWGKNSTDIPIPPVPTDPPDTFSLPVQKFWFGHIPDAKGN